MKHACNERERPEPGASGNQVEAIGPIAAADEQAAKQARRGARHAALLKSSGIWAGEPNKARDGMIYQRELRAEWL